MRVPTDCPLSTLYCVLRPTIRSRRTIARWHISATLRSPVNTPLPRRRFFSTEIGRLFQIPISHYLHRRHNIKSYQYYYYIICIMLYDDSPNTSITIVLFFDIESNHEFIRIFGILSVYHTFKYLGFYAILWECLLEKTRFFL